MRVALERDDRGASVTGGEGLDFSLTGPTRGVHARVRCPVDVAVELGAS